MICKIAELIVQLPEAGGMPPRCREYLTDDKRPADIVITEEMLKLDRWKDLSYEDSCYMETGFHFYARLLRFEGLMLHSSAVEYQGKAYLFSGPCTVGKSTHTQLWQQAFGYAAQVFNDDKPALRFIDGQWFAFGTPWCGKDGINQNKKVPLAGICFLKQGKENYIRKLPAKESIPRVLSQTTKHVKLPENRERLLSHIDRLVRQVPVFELENNGNVEAAYLSHQTMSAE